MQPPIPSPYAYDCPNCGATIYEVKTKYCPLCGAILKVGSRLSSAQISALIGLSVLAAGAVGVCACSISVIKGKGELPELGWIGFWPAVIVLALCAFGVIHVLRKK